MLFTKLNFAIAELIFQLLCFENGNENATVNN